MTTFEKVLLGIGVYIAFSSNNEQAEEAAIGKMNTHRFVPVLREKSENGNNRYNLKHTVNKTGVYIIKENGKIVYVGYSGYNLYKTITRHFQAWNHPSQEVITYQGKEQRNRYTIRVVFTSPTRAIKLEEALIIKYRPRDNAQVLNLFDLEAKEVVKIEKQHEKVLTEYDNADKWDYPPDWDDF